MSSFVLAGSSPACRVSLVDDLTESELTSFPAFKTWSSTLSHSLALQDDQSHPFHADPYRLRGITVQSIDRFGGGRLGFVKMTADVFNDGGEKLPGAILLRGGSVTMMASCPHPLFMTTG